MLIYVCDDNSEHQRNIGKMIEQYFSDRKVACRIEYFSNGHEMLEMFDQKREMVDVFFMDIELGEDNGIEIAKELLKLREDNRIIYISSHKKYVFDVFDTHPVNYLVKPLKRQKVFQVLERIYEKDRISHKLKLTVERRPLELEVDRIIYIQSQGRVIHIYTENDEFVTYEKVDRIVQQLNAVKEGFIRIHKSYVVNYDHVEAFRWNEVLMDNGQVLSISRPYREDVKRYSMKYIEHRIHSME